MNAQSMDAVLAHHQQQTMRAVVQSAYGAPDVFGVQETARPTIGPAEVLVLVRAAGIDRGTWHLMTGKPYLLRLIFGFSRPKNQVPGFDVAGTVAEVGAQVTRFAVGDEVFGVSRGSCAEYAVAREDKLARKPAVLSFEQAAVMGISALTALQSLRDGGRLQPGQRVLIVGASGGVGSYAVQLAKALGANVTGVCSTAKVELVRSLGADQVLDYQTSDFASSEARYDLILDIGDNASISRLRRALTPTGTAVLVGGEGGNTLIGAQLVRGLGASLLAPFRRQRVVMFMCKEHFADLEQLAKLSEAGALTPSL